MHTQVIGTVTTFHIGSVFCFVGVLLLLAPLLLYGKQPQREIAELIGTGIICLIIGLFLICLNRVYGNREEQDLEAYVRERLGRSESGGMVYRAEEEEPNTTRKGGSDKGRGPRQTQQQDPDGIEQV